MIYNSFEDTGLLKVLTFLKTHNTEYLSGQDLSDVLRIAELQFGSILKKFKHWGIQ